MITITRTAVLGKVVAKELRGPPHDGHVASISTTERAVGRHRTVSRMYGSDLSLFPTSLAAVAGW